MKGNEIGIEIMHATRRVVKAIGEKTQIDELEVGAKVDLSGNTIMISKSSWETIRKSKLFLSSQSVLRTLELKQKNSHGFDSKKRLYQQQF